jgi:DNA-repair protein complementing XP-A cells
MSTTATVPNSVRNAAAAMSIPSGDSAIRPAKKFNNFIEYDFSKMSDTKAGFLSANDDPHNKALHLDVAEDPYANKPAGMTMEEWERHVLLKKLRATKQGPFEPGLSAADATDSAKVQEMCRECGSLEVDWKWIEIFKCGLCNSCKEKFPEKYSLLTKTEAREDYLLTNRKSVYGRVTISAN